MPTIDIPISEDTQIGSSAPTTNYSTANNINVGEQNNASAIWRSWIKPNFTSIPVNANITSAILKLTPIMDLSDNARTMYAHRCLRDVVSNQATWNIWKTSNNWGTAGASGSGTDFDATALGSMSQPASPTLNTPLSLTLSAAEIQKFYNGTYTNNGIILFVDTQVNDMISYASVDHATSAYRPIITITYTIPGFFLFF